MFSQIKTNTKRTHIANLARFTSSSCSATHTRARLTRSNSDAYTHTLHTRTHIIFPTRCECEPFKLRLNACLYPAFAEKCIDYILLFTVDDTHTQNHTPLAHTRLLMLSVYVYWMDYLSYYYYVLSGTRTRAN